jgi:hypothetical protein
MLRESLRSIIRAAPSHCRRFAAPDERDSGTDAVQEPARTAAVLLQCPSGVHPRLVLLVASMWATFAHGVRAEEHSLTGAPAKVAAQDSGAGAAPAVAAAPVRFLDQPTSVNLVVGLGTPIGEFGATVSLPGCPLEVTCSECNRQRDRSREARPSRTNLVHRANGARDARRGNLDRQRRIARLRS